jgi:hypothetical protein
LSDVFTQAIDEGPQFIRKNDRMVVMLSESEYRRLTGDQPTLIEYLRNGPGLDDLDLRRGSAPMRDIEW